MTKTAPLRSLIFVYNADSSPLAEAFDFLHKVFSPATYACNLCKVTYGTFGIKKEWREFIQGRPWPTAFYHRDEFQNRYPRLSGTPLPAVFAERNNGGLELLASADDLNEQHSVEAMKKLILAKL